MSHQQPQILHDYYRQCPGEAYKISDAVCGQRQKHHYPKCPKCPWNNARLHDHAADGDPAAPAFNEVHMIEKVYKAYDIRGIYPDPLNEEIAWKTGHATAQFLRMNLTGLAKADPRMNMIIVGRDMRLSSPSLAKALIDGILSTGTNVIDIGMIDTPQIYFAINHLGCCGGIQVTASHNPANYNGFKISGIEARPIGENTGLHEIKRLAMNLRKGPAAQMGRVESMDLSRPYKSHVLQFLKLHRPLKVVVDCSNGMAGKFVPTIFVGQPNLEIISINTEINGSFKHEPNPLVDANLRELQEAVLSHGADFGVCFDGDADRCIFVDEQAKVVRCDILTAFLAKDFLKKSPGSAIIYDLRSSRVVREEILNAGGVPKRERVGHVFMKKALADSHGVFGGELSGHFYFRDNFKTDSGAIVFAVTSSVLSGYDQPLSHILKPLQRYYGSGEINFEVHDKDAAIAKLADRYKDASVDYLDGITIEYDTWWFNVRKSNTEPLLRLNLEANTADLLRKKLDEVGGQLGTPVHH
ncbi:MAG TPA: phosphomannomutase/phosphoglucomutase [Phycisphaerae bacterium]|nr:phosphomannomutase/phosphoglucomutase [Phycisphaerae bacterium]